MCLDCLRPALRRAVCVHTLQSQWTSRLSNFLLAYPFPGLWNPPEGELLFEGFTGGGVCYLTLWSNGLPGRSVIPDLSLPLSVDCWAHYLWFQASGILVRIRGVMRNASIVVMSSQHVHSEYLFHAAPSQVPTNSNQPLTPAA